jgi:hypothetical protein
MRRTNHTFNNCLFVGLQLPSWALSVVSDSLATRNQSYREVLAAIEAGGGPSMSIGYLSQLVTGARTK